MEHLDPHSVSLREFFDEKFNNVTEKIEGVDSKQDQMLEKQDFTNGRIKKLEVVVAVLQLAYVIGAAVISAYVFNLMKNS